MDNLMKIILVVLVAFMLLNYSCSKKENFTKRRREKKCNKKCIKRIKKCFKNNFKGKCNINENKKIKKCKVPVNALTKKQTNSLESYFSKVCVKKKRKRKKSVVDEEIEKVKDNEKNLGTCKKAYDPKVKQILL